MHSFKPKSRNMSIPDATASPDDAIVPGSAKFDAIIGDMTPDELREFADYIATKLDSTAEEPVEDIEAGTDEAGGSIPDADAEPDDDSDPLEGLEMEESDEDDAI